MARPDCDVAVVGAGLAGAVEHRPDRDRERLLQADAGVSIVPLASAVNSGDSSRLRACVSATITAVGGQILLQQGSQAMALHGARGIA